MTLYNYHIPILMEDPLLSFVNLHRKHSVAVGADPFNLKKVNFKFRKLSHENNLKTVHHFANNEWMKKHGKGEFIDLSSKERAKIRAIFKELDRDGSGALGIDELYEPLLALGLVENKEQVRDMIAKVDSNGSGLIEFDEFIRIIKQNGTENNALISFFKDLSNETVFKEFRDLPFNLILSNRRRELMLQSYLGKNNNAREHGRKVMNAFALEIKEQEQEMTKAEKLRLKKEMNLRKLLERQNGIRVIVDEKKANKGTFIGNVSRPQTASRKPMTRKEILML